MKKALAILLVVLTLASLAACGNNASTSSSSASPSASAAASPSSSVATSPSASASSAAAASTAASAKPSASPSAAAKPVEVGFFDPSIDYSKNKKFKVVYMIASSGALFDSMDKAFKMWADRTNCDYTFWCANGDMDLFLSNIQTFTDQGMDGFLLDGDATTYPRIGDVMKEVKKPWMTGMANPIGADGKYNHPLVGFDYLLFGRTIASWLCDYAKKTWPNAKPAEIGYIAHDYSIVPSMHVRMPVEQEVWNKAYPGADKNYFIADGASQPNAALNADTGYNITAPIISAHPEIKYWLVGSQFDDFAMGAARALEATGKDKNAAVICSGGSGFITQADAGDTGCWKGALYTSEILITEPTFNGLYAQMTGKATAESLWPEWVDKAGGQTYASIQNLASLVITADNYKSYLGFCNQLVGISNPKYVWDGTNFPLHADTSAQSGTPATASPSK